MTSKLAIVMPAYNAAELLTKTLPPLLSAQPDGGVWVVDPGSTDSTAMIAEDLGAHVIRLPQREGPAIARNAGVKATDAQIILFIDADCLMPEDLPARVEKLFENNPQMVALTGSYDAKPAHRGLVSLYMNLRHHYTHQHASQVGSTFWAGMGAVRRNAFDEAGGFDGERFPRPMIEDIELGLRLARLGENHLDPTLQVKHLKHWTLGGMIRTDIMARAIPWTQLIQETGQIPDDLNLKWSERLAALIAPLSLAGAAALPFSLLVGRMALIGLVPIAFSILLSAQFLSLLARRGGIHVAIGGWALHQLHLFYSATCFVVCSVLRKKEASS